MKRLISLIYLLILFACKEESNELALSDVKSHLQVFSIKNDRDTLLIGNKGTRIKFRGKSFITANGQGATGDVIVKVAEFYTIEDFIANRLSTNTIDGRILRSSGMVFIEAATRDGSILQLKDSMPMTIAFRRIQDSRTANLFAGVRGPTNEVRWRSLTPVHNDTITIVTTTVTELSYGEEMVNVEIMVVVGKDTLELTDANRQDFEKILIDYRTDSPIQEKPYVFETTSLGYLNCDIFIDDKLYPFVVKSDNNRSDVFVVMDSLNSVFYPESISESTNEYIFHFPKNLPVTVVAYRKHKDRHFFKIERTKTNSPNVTIRLTEAPLEKIRNEIKNLAQNAR